MNLYTVIIIRKRKENTFETCHHIIVTIYMSYPEIERENGIFINLNLNQQVDIISMTSVSEIGMYL